MKYLSQGIKWGLILGIAQVAGTQILTWIGLGTSSWFPVFIFAAVLVLAIFFIRDVINTNGGKIKIAHILLPLLIMIIISRYVFQIYMFIYIHYIDPNWIDVTAQNWTVMLQEQGISDEVIQKRMDIFRRSYETVGMFTTEIFFYALPQFILGFVASAFYNWRKK